MFLVLVGPSGSEWSCFDGLKVFLSALFGLVERQLQAEATDIETGEILPQRRRGSEEVEGDSSEGSLEVRSNKRLQTAGKWAQIKYAQG